MESVLKCRLLSGVTVDLCAYSFKFTDLTGAEILSGDDYFVKKALSKGAVKPEPEEPKPKRKSKSK